MSFMHDIGDIDFPEDWTQHTIEEVAHFSRGLSWAKRDETDKDNGNLVVSIPNVRDGHIDFESKFNHYLGCPIPEAKRLRVGDIVFVGSSGSLQNVGRNAKVRELPTPVVAFASFTFKATPDREVIDPDFFYHLVNSDLVPFEDYCSRAADGKFNFQLVDFKSKQQLRLPGKEEQQRIAQVLSTVQEAIAQQERLIRTTTELKQALMQKLFTEGLRGEALRETEIGMVPESWEVVKLGDLCSLTTGRKDVNEGSPDGPYPFFTCSTEVYRSPVYSFDTEAILVAGNGKVGETKYYSGKFEAYQRTYVLSDFRTHGPFIYQFLKERLSTELNRVVSGSTMPYIRKGDLENVLVPVPSDTEQLQITAQIETVDRKVQIHEQRHAALQDLFRTLLHELMTGKVRVGQGVSLDA